MKENKLIGGYDDKGKYDTNLLRKIFILFKKFLGTWSDGILI